MPDSSDICPETVESAELILQNVSVLSELTNHLLKETRNGESSINSLNNLVHQAGKEMISIHQCVNSVIMVAKKLVYLSLQIVPTDNPNFQSLKNEADKVLNVLGDLKDKDEDKSDMKWKGLEKLGQYKGNFKCIDDKYPERCSRESLLDISNVVNLPTVPEDAFTNFQRPSKTSSSCSLKNLRKIKLCLQKAAYWDTEEEFDLPLNSSRFPRKEFDQLHPKTQATRNSSLMPATDGYTPTKELSSENKLIL